MEKNMNDFNLCVQIEINGTFKKTGTISGTNSLDAVFSYDRTYLEKKEARPISINMPFSKKISSKETRTFFEGLLPGGFYRRQIMESMQIEEDDYISILKILGKECLGAIVITDESEKKIESNYEQIDLKDLDFNKIISAGKLSDLQDTHLSVNGACKKISLYYDSENNRWYQPNGSASGNYIMKSCNDIYEDLSVNEQLCLSTAKRLGIEIPESFILKVNNESFRPTVLFATERYDRTIDQNSRYIGKLPVPYRLHQEDFAQALGIPLSQKYEPEGKHYLKSMFDVLRLHSSNSSKDMARLWKMCVFNFFIGNTDNHIKNFSLVYSKDLNSVRLAPFYDVSSTLIYENISKKMAFSINHKVDITKITKEDFRKESRLIDLDEHQAMQIYDEIKDNLKTALYESAEELESSGFMNAKNIAERILTVMKRLINL